MAELDVRLRELAPALAFPPTPDLTAVVRARLDVEPPARRWRLPLQRRALVIALAVLVVAVGAVLAVPPARTAVLEWLGLKGVTIRVVEALPEVRSQGADLGEPTTLANARRADPGLVEPHVDGLGAPDAVYAQPFGSTTILTFIWGDERTPRLVMTQVRGEAVFEKLLGPGTEIESQLVGGQAGVWIEGRPHALIFRAPDGDVADTEARLARNALIWQQGDRTVRLEAGFTRTEALKIARSVR